MITGTGVHDRPDSVFTINWNRCSRSNGIDVHHPPERAGRASRGIVGEITKRDRTSSPATL